MEVYPKKNGNATIMICMNFIVKAYKLKDSGITNFLSDAYTPNTIGVVLTPSLESNSTSFRLADIPTLNNHCIKASNETIIARDEMLLETVNAPNIPRVKTPILRIYSIPKKRLLYLL